MKKISAIILALILTASIFSACSASSNAPQKMSAPAPAAAPAASSASNATAIMGGFGSRDMAVTQDAVEYEAAATEVPVAPPMTGGGEAGSRMNQAADSRKIVKNVNIQLQTLTFDKSVDTVVRIAESFGGFVQDSYVEGRDMYNERGTRSANFTIRVPSEQLDSFVNSFGGAEFNVISKSQNSQDITESYYDSKARLDALKTQEERLLSMLEKAEELEYLLQVEKELMNVRYEIESLTSSLNRMDSYVSLSSVYISLTEVIKYEQIENVPINFGERISRAFTGSWISFSEFAQDFTVILISILPFLLLLLIIALVVIIIVRKARKNPARREKNAAAYIPPKFNTAPPTTPEEAATPDENKK